VTSRRIKPVPRSIAVLVACLVVATATALGSGLSSAHADGATTSVLFTGLNNPRGLTFGPDGQAVRGGGRYRRHRHNDGTAMPAGAGDRSIQRRFHGEHLEDRRDWPPHDRGQRASLGPVQSPHRRPGEWSRRRGLPRQPAVRTGSGCRLLTRFAWHVQQRLSRASRRHHHAHREPERLRPGQPDLVENPGDFEPDGTWYSMVNSDGAFYAAEPNHGEVDRITVGGHISRLMDVSAAALPLGLGNPAGHIVPTSLTFHNHSFYLTNLDVFDPGFQNQSRVFRIGRAGQLETGAGGLNAAVGVAFDSQGRLYALEAFTGFFAPAPFTANSGMVVRLNSSGGWDTIASGLNFPTAMTFGPDGGLYVSNCGFGCPAGAGQVVRIAVG
jgi:hypothetical protein